MLKVKKIFLCVIFSAFLMAVAASAQETLAQSIVKYRDFFEQLNGYSDYLLGDVEDIERGKLLGIILLSPEGFEQHLVFDVSNMKLIYANARILDKNSRAFLLDTSIGMSEVKKLAAAAKIRAEELKRGWTLHEGKPGNIIPKSKNISAKK